MTGWVDASGVEHLAVSVGDLGNRWELRCKCGAKVECQDSVEGLKRHLEEVGAR